MDNRDDIKVGDIVECVDDYNLKDGMHILMLGTKYIVRSVDVKGDEHGACCQSEWDNVDKVIRIANINNATCWEERERGYSINRFIKVKKLKIQLV